MTEQLAELKQCITAMNNDGLNRLVNLAKDIVSNKNFKRSDCSLQNNRFDRQTHQVIAMVNNAYLAHNGQKKRYPPQQRKYLNL